MKQYNFLAKTCSVCGTFKPLGEFYRHKATLDKRKSQCRKCDYQKIKRWREQNRLKHRAQVKKYQARNKEKVNAYHRKYRALNPLVEAAQHKARRAAQQGKIKKTPCEICGSPAVAHHDDYNKPLEVRWLCTLHHIRFHVEGVPKPCHTR